MPKPLEDRKSLLERIAEALERISGSLESIADASGRAVAEWLEYRDASLAAARACEMEDIPF